YEYGDKYKDEKYKNISGYYCNLYILPGDIKSIECYAMNCELKKQENGSTSVVWYARVLGDVDEYTHCVPSEDFKKETAFSDFHFFVSAIESREYNRDSSLQSFWLSNTSPNNSGDGQTFTINDLLEDRKIETLPGFKNMENLKKDLISVEKYLKRLEDYKMILERLHDTDPEQLKKRKKSLQSIIREQKSLLKALQIELHTKVSKRPKNTEINLIVFRNMNSTRSNLGAHNEILDVFISTYQKRH
ncbi:hypothetical protein NEMIN01_2354, partial [Nematocida minor]|uniref:uncharacterized protein n=1 Tax=Nematocida minor TaxID=1912983 RepID=UPI00221F4BE6